MFISFTVFPGGNFSKWKSSLDLWNRKHVCAHVHVCVRACLGGEGEGRRVTASPNKPDRRTRNQQSATVRFSVPMYTYLFHLISHAFPLEGLRCWQMSSFGSFFPPGTEHLLDVRCCARNLQEYGRTRYGVSGLSLFVGVCM